MSAGFTPGPWDFERNPNPRDVPRPWIGRLSDNRYSALACGETDAEAIANARLIAASPTMAEYIQRKADEGDEEAARIMEIVHAGR